MWGFYIFSFIHLEFFIYSSAHLCAQFCVLHCFLLGLLTFLPSLLQTRCRHGTAATANPRVCASLGRERRSGSGWILFHSPCFDAHSAHISKFIQPMLPKQFNFYCTHSQKQLWSVYHACCKDDPPYGGDHITGGGGIWRSTSIGMYDDRRSGVGGHKGPVQRCKGTKVPFYDNLPICLWVIPKYRRLQRRLHYGGRPLVETTPQRSDEVSCPFGPEYSNGGDSPNRKGGWPASPQHWRFVLSQDISITHISSQIVAFSTACNDVGTSQTTPLDR